MWNLTRYCGLVLFGVGIVFGAAPNSQVGLLHRGDLSLGGQDVVHYISMLTGAWLLSLQKAWRDL